MHACDGWCMHPAMAGVPPSTCRDVCTCTHATSCINVIPDYMHAITVTVRWSVMAIACVAVSQLPLYERMHHTLSLHRPTVYTCISPHTRPRCTTYRIHITNQFKQHPQHDTHNAAHCPHCVACARMRPSMNLLISSTLESNFVLVFPKMEFERLKATTCTKVALTYAVPAQYRT